MQLLDRGASLADPVLGKRVRIVTSPFPILPGQSDSSETIHLVNDDRRVLQAVSEVLECLGGHVVHFLTASAYLNYSRTESPSV